MERSAINSGLEPMPHSQHALQKFRPSEKSHDVTILVTWACVAIGAVIAIYALTVSGAVAPDAFATMVAFP
jgi:hypothetical protein